MNKLSNFIKSTGNLLGNGIENVCENTGEILYKSLKRNNHNSMAKGAKGSGKLLGKVGSLTTKSIFNIAGITLESGVKFSKFTGKVIKQKAVKKEVKIYGESKEFYKGKFVEADYKIIDKK
ncbi:MULTISPECIES: hypothetical protein [Clostridium]|uniref:Uncharacterized protein n=2 Tax=Clostridium TaxID=1485 RepID=A0A7X5P9H3_CLOSG|nr:MULTISPECIES: hypothetical protein [Clostridium]AJD31809.1 hypothetical protein T258_3117 [Clostridium botulinum Prevot_594]AVP62219.1 hypothetical protein C7M79_16580 [Clostridium botulinum]AKC61278.1 hypothetical protein CLSPO_c05550 [Clostridium sporogenes]AKJ88619.1 hypothetical protein CLSPOx_02775 [Clostridium sporogenes]AVP65877.1 hypothetical protein C3B64_17155 [Clostridium botulinum]